MESSVLMKKFAIPLVVFALVPLQGAYAGAAAGKAKAVACHPEWNKGGACRAYAQSNERGSSVNKVASACHPEWSKGRACAVRTASLAAEGRGLAAEGEQSGRLADSQ